MIFVEIAFIITLIAGVGTGLAKLLKKEANLTEKVWGVFVCYTGVLIVYLLSREQYWVLCKVMIWMSPFIYYMLVCFIESASRIIRTYYVAVGSFVICVNLLFYAARVESAWNGEGSRYYENYPIALGLKNMAEWNLDMDLLKDAKIIRIEDDFEVHYFRYLKQAILYAGKEYYTGKNIIKNYDYGEEVARMDYKEYDALVYANVAENGRMELNYVTGLSGKLPSDLIYRRISLAPFDTLVIGHNGFADGGSIGVWTTEQTADIQLMGPFMYDSLELCVEVIDFSKAEAEASGKELRIQIGDEEKTVLMNEAGKYVFRFEHVKGNDRIAFLTDKFLTPFEMGISEDKDTGYGVRIKSIELSH